MKEMVLSLCTNFPRDECMKRRALLRFTAGNEVRPWPADGVFNKVGNDSC